jgi:hypothetical protein
MINISVFAGRKNFLPFVDFTQKLGREKNPQILECMGLRDVACEAGRWTELAQWV